MCYLLFILHMMMHTRCCRRRLKSVSTLFVVLAVCAESSTFKSKRCAKLLSVSGSRGGSSHLQQENTANHNIAHS